MKRNIWKDLWNYQEEIIGNIIIGSGYENYRRLCNILVVTEEGNALLNEFQSELFLAFMWFYNNIIESINLNSKYPKTAKTMIKIWSFENLSPQKRELNYTWIIFIIFTLVLCHWLLIF